MVIVSLILKSTPYAKNLERGKANPGGTSSRGTALSPFRQFCNLHEVAASVELEIVESIPHFSSLSLSISSSIWRRHTRMQTSLSFAFPFLSPVIRALIGGTRLWHRDVPHDKAIRGNFSDGQVPGRGEQRDGKRNVSAARTSLSVVKGMPRGSPNGYASLSYRKSICGKSSARFSRERFWCSVILTLPLLRISLRFAPLKWGGVWGEKPRIFATDAKWS